MAEVYLVPGDGLYVGLGGPGTPINSGSQISGTTPGPYTVTLGAKGQGADTPTGFVLPTGWDPRAVATILVNGISRAKLWCVNQAAYTLLRSQWPDSGITIQPGQEANITRTP